MDGGLVAISDCEQATEWKLCVRVTGQEGKGRG